MRMNNERDYYNTPCNKRRIGCYCHLLVGGLLQEIMDRIGIDVFYFDLEETKERLAEFIEAVKNFGDVRGWKRLEVTTQPLPQFDETLSFYEREGFEISGGRKLKKVW